MEKEDTTLEEFLKEKMSNLLKYIDSIIGVDNELYKQLFSIKDNSTLIIQFTSTLASVATKKNIEYAGKKYVDYELDKKLVQEYIKQYNISSEKITDDVLDKISQYLSLFCFVIDNN